MTAPLAGGDSFYSSANLSTKIRRVGVWFSNYNALASGGLATTPRAYLIPVGLDVIRARAGETSQVRTWNVVDQILPLPFALGENTLAAPGYIPRLELVDPVTEAPFGAIRRFADFRARHDDESNITVNSVGTGADTNKAVTGMSTTISVPQGWKVMASVLSAMP